MKAQRKTINNNNVRTLIRFLIQAGFFLLFPSVYSSCYAGVKYLFTQIGQGARIELTPFVTILIVLCAYTIVFGRFFCGFACAFGSLGDWLYGIHEALARKLGRTPKVIPEPVIKRLSGLKYLIAALIPCLCAAGVWSSLHGVSPWDAFSQFITLRPRLEDYGIGIALLAGIMVLMFFRPRFFCRVLCPMGAVFSLLPVLPVFSLHRDRQACIQGCSLCTRKCPAGVELPDRRQFTVSGGCFQCQKCISPCPRKHIRYGVSSLRGDEIWFTLLRAGILAALLVWLGI